jgi:hypothetical protein
MRRVALLPRTLLAGAIALISMLKGDATDRVAPPLLTDPPDVPAEVVSLSLPEAPPFAQGPIGVFANAELATGRGTARSPLVYIAT